MRTSSVVAGHAGGYSFRQFRGPICQHTGRSVAAFVLLILVALICGCGGSDIATQRPPLDLAGPMNVTFFVTSDVHCSNGPLPLPARAGIQAMNGHVAGLPDPADAGAAIQKAAFAVTLGDVTTGGLVIPASDAPHWYTAQDYTTEYKTFNTYLSRDGVKGDANRLSVPDYASVGNHDYYNYLGQIVSERSRYVATQLGTRENASVITSEGNVAYSFDTNGVHMVMLGRWADPGVLQWLQRDLAAVGTSAYVVLGIHYPLDNSDYNDLDTWYKPADRNALGAVIAGYKVVAILNGHTHVANTYKWTPAHAAGAPAYTYDCIDDGSLGRVGDFGVMHITLSKLTYAQYLPTFNKTGDWTGGGFTNVRLSKDLGS